MAIIESNITLNFPDSNYFRFQDCKGYKDIQDNFKEMDACWYDVANDILYLIELKDWKDGKLMEENNPNFSTQQIQEIKEIKRGISQSHIHNLVKKSIDSVSMIMSVLLGKPYSANIQACASFTISNSTKIKLLSIVNWTNTDTTYIANVNTAYKSKFKPYAKLYDIQTFIVMTKTQAISQFTWIS